MNRSEMSRLLNPPITHPMWRNLKYLRLPTTLPRSARRGPNHQSTWYGMYQVRRMEPNGYSIKKPRRANNTDRLVAVTQLLFHPDRLVVPKISEEQSSTHTATTSLYIIVSMSHDRSPYYPMWGGNSRAEEQPSVVSPKGLTSMLTCQTKSLHWTSSDSTPTTGSLSSGSRRDQLILNSRAEHACNRELSPLVSLAALSPLSVVSGVRSVHSGAMPHNTKKEDNHQC